MRLIPLSSSVLASAGYDEMTETLQVVFVNGRSYIHHGVPESVYKALLEADSAGRYYSANIKGQYG